MNLFYLFIFICIILYISALNWRVSLKTVLVILIIEGALRKWFLPQAKDFLFFLKDLVLLGAYIRFFISKKNLKNIFKLNQTINILLVYTFIWGIIQAVNPKLCDLNECLIIGTLGLKNYFFYIPLIWMMPKLFRTHQELYSFLRFYLLLSIPVGILGIVQFSSPLNSPINRYVEETEYIAGYLGRARITGTFSYIGTYMQYLNVSFSLLLPFLSLEKHKTWRLLLIAAFVLIVANSFMTGSRTVVFSILLIGALYILWEFANALKFKSSQLRRFSSLLTAVILLTLAVGLFFGTAKDTFIERAVTVGTKESGSIVDQNRISLLWEDPISVYQVIGGIDGYGIGATHNTTKAIRGVLNLKSGEPFFMQYEQEAGRIMLEMGIVGFFCWYGLRIMILFNLFLVFIRIKNPFYKRLVLSALLVHLTQFRSHMVFNHTFALYYWFLSGFILMLPLLEAQTVGSMKYYRLQQPDA